MTRVDDAGRPRIDVAVGILLAEDGRFLLASRPAGKPLAGFWEFPGGKLEPGETPADAVARELAEELGIAVEPAAGCRPLPPVEHDYPEMAVRLHPCLVTVWRGTPTPREGQELRWQAGTAVDIGVGPLLPATLPILGMLADLAGSRRAHAAGTPAPANAVTRRTPSRHAAGRGGDHPTSG